MFLLLSHPLLSHIPLALRSHGPNPASPLRTKTFVPFTFSLHGRVHNPTLHVTAAHYPCASASTSRHSRDLHTPNESANHPIHRTRQTMLYMSSECRCENNDSLIQVKKGYEIKSIYFIMSPIFPSEPAI